jgi:hypothetical protein
LDKTKADRMASTQGKVSTWLQKDVLRISAHRGRRFRLMVDAISA